MTHKEKLDDLEAKWKEVMQLTREVTQEVEAQRKQAEETMIENITMDGINEEKLETFTDKPYLVLPKGETEAWVVVPRFVPFQVGWLERQTTSYNVFVVNKYVDWIQPLPEEIRARVGIEPYLETAKVYRPSSGRAAILEVDPDELDKAYRRYRENLYGRVAEDRIKINKGAEFDVIASLIDDGVLPFTPSPIEEEQIREEPEKVSLRSYQERAWEKFKETGAIGVYWAPKAGKTFLALYAGERIKGKKLVVVPTNTLKEQWNNRIRKFCEHQGEWDVQTYQYITHYHLEEYQRKDLQLTIFDEVHHLPANTFSKLATLKTTYRMGLSASPYREDGRTEYIFALTGFPVGLKWRELIKIGVVEEPQVKVYLYSTEHRKQQGVKELVKHSTGKTLVFCDSISEGKQLSKELEVPFVYSNTSNRMEKFKNNRVVIGSRVADEGISLGDLDTVIEYDFLYGSRRQEAQRAGRVMHGEGSGEHIIMMTDEELNKYGKRLYSLEEQGFQIKFERRK